MIRYIVILLLLNFLLPVQLRSQGVYKSSSVEIDFFSSAPIEDIHAISDKGISVWNIKSEEVSFLVQIVTFQFRKSKMQTHFNEKFMESDQYPYATFKGRSNGLPDNLTDGTYSVTFKGDLEIKGITRAREFPASLKVENGKLYLESQFEVACEDHDIAIPRIFWKNIAEVIEVNVKAVYSK